MKIAFWNVNIGSGSFADKQKTFKTWCAEIKPDLLCLEEVSFTQTDNDWHALRDASAMIPLDHVATLDVNGNATTKQIAALCQKDNPYALTARPLRLDGLISIRMGLKITTTKSATQIYAIHANASNSGGAAATEAAKGLITGKDVLVGGDFNCNMSKVDGKPMASKRYDGVALPFTQWASTGNTMDKAAQQKAFGFKNVFVNKVLTPTANGVIDFIMFGSNVNPVAELNCVSESTWRDVVAQFDHAPIVYTI